MTGKPLKEELYSPVVVWLDQVLRKHQLQKPSQHTLLARTSPEGWEAEYFSSWLAPHAWQPCRPAAAHWLPPSHPRLSSRSTRVPSGTRIQTIGTSPQEPPCQADCRAATSPLTHRERESSVSESTQTLPWRHGSRREACGRSTLSAAQLSREHSQKQLRRGQSIKERS